MWMYEPQLCDQVQGLGLVKTLTNHGGWNRKGFDIRISSVSLTFLSVICYAENAMHLKIKNTLNAYQRNGKKWKIIPEFHEAGWPEFRGPADRATQLNDGARCTRTSCHRPKVLHNDAQTPRANSKLLHWPCRTTQRKQDANSAAFRGIFRCWRQKNDHVT